MNILETLIKLRDDLKQWVTINLQALNQKIDDKTFPIDEELDPKSENPVQNKTITHSFDNLITEIDNIHNSYESMEDAPPITSSYDDEFIITDYKGNVIAKIDSSGLSTTGLSLNEMIKTDEAKFALADENHNIIFEVNEDGTVTTSLKLKGNYGKDFVESNSEDFIVADGEGNIVFKIDDEGVYSTQLILNGKNIGIELNKIIDLVGGKPVSQQVLEVVEQAIGDFGESGGAISFGSSSNLNINELLPDAFVITDDYGNIALQTDKDGMHIPALILQGRNILDIINEKPSNDRVTELIDTKIETAMNNIPLTLADLGITYGTTDLTAGSSKLTTGHFYFVYE